MVADWPCKHPLIRTQSFWTSGEAAIAAKRPVSIPIGKTAALSLRPTGKMVPSLGTTPQGGYL
jgi:hypothetical protein